ncbi:uncharacterized protein [Mytilus edulis]|uniref:uncharacterized protein n=1 Tax=Mytilus edulis TaxID=6550 RepID=UPI0039EFBB15
MAQFMETNLLILKTTILLFLVESHGHILLQDYKEHPCIRPCKTDHPMTCEYNFTVEYYYTLTKSCYECPYNTTDCGRPHCVPADGNQRGIITVNRMLPGPGIHVCYNDTIVVNVHNKLEGSEGTSVHWHGIHQRESQFMDGVAMVTQCPILPYTSFQYKFKASTSGTHFWHAHSGLQRSDGFFGPLVIRQTPEQDPQYSMYDIDTPEYTVIINDWLTELSINKFAHHYLADGDNKPASMLINGKGAFQKFTTRTGGEVYTPFEVFTIDSGRRYRFRLISNGLLFCPKHISIDDHNFTVIATDGTPIEPIEVESLIMYNGERYDIIINGDQPVDNYWMRVVGLADCEVKNASQLAIIRYRGANETDPSESRFYDDVNRDGKILNPLNAKETEKLIPVSSLVSKLDDDASLKDVPDKRFYLAMDFYNISNYRLNDMYQIHDHDHIHYTPQINHISNILPPSPVLSQFNDIPKELLCNPETLNKTTDCTKEYCECVHVQKVSLGDTVELVLIDEGHTYDANHPMHLHGNYFRVVGMDRLGSTTTLEEVKKLDDLGLLQRNLTKRAAKDTVTVPDGGYTIVRFHATNPGFWFFHCHIEFHAEVGMGLVFQVGEIHEHPKSPLNFPKCGSWY